jgi:hypothetical protein
VFLGGVAKIYQTIVMVLKIPTNISSAVARDGLKTPTLVVTLRNGNNNIKHPVAISLYGSSIIEFFCDLSRL